MRGTKAKALRRRVAHLPESTAVQQYGRLATDVVTGKINLDGTSEVVERAFDFPLTFKHNGRRRAYQDLKRMSKAA